MLHFLYGRVYNARAHTFIKHPDLYIVDSLDKWILLFYVSYFASLFLLYRCNVCSYICLPFSCVVEIVPPCSFRVYFSQPPFLSLYTHAHTQRCTTSCLNAPLFQRKCEISYVHSCWQCNEYKSIHFLLLFTPFLVSFVYNTGRFKRKRKYSGN